jgi:hypothetical protein
MGLLESTLDTLGYVGDSLDKLGGRPLRGLLGGHPDELLSVVPFSDRFGLTDPSRIVSGRNLTDRWGLSKEGSDSWGDSAKGFAAELALDPWNLVGIGAASKWAKGAGKAAEAARGLGKAGEAARGADAVAGLARASDDAAGMLSKSMHSFGHPAARGPGVPLLPTGAVEGGAGLSARFKPLRSQFGAIRDVTVGPDGVVQGARMVGDGGAPVDHLAELLNIAPKVKASGTEGLFVPEVNSALTFLGATPETMRHENIHGLIRNAARTGQAGTCRCS